MPYTDLDNADYNDIRSNALCFANMLLGDGRFDAEDAMAYADEESAITWVVSQLRGDRRYHAAYERLQALLQQRQELRERHAGWEYGE